MDDKAARVGQYRSKAEEVRAIAASMKDVETKRTLLSVADDYLMLADVLERSHINDPFLPPGQTQSKG